MRFLASFKMTMKQGPIFINCTRHSKLKKKKEIHPTSTHYIVKTTIHGKKEKIRMFA